MKFEDNGSEPNDEILIVEDSPTQAERLKYVLEKNRYRFVTARNGREALACIAARPPTLVISDVVMPEMDGYQLCRHLKQDAKFKNIPVILLTSLTDPVDVVRGLECGADNFVFKPYDEAYLLSRIGYISANRRLRSAESTRMGVEIYFAGQKFFITSDRLQILNLLLSTYETAVERNRELADARDDLRDLNETLEAKVQERTAALQAEIVERKQAEAQVHEQAELLNKARDAIMAVDLEHRITYWNASAERLYGWTSAEALGRKIGDLQPDDGEDRFAAAQAALLADGEWRGDCEVTTKTGTVKNVSSTWSLVRGADDRPRSILLIDTDITEQKRLEADLLRSQRMESIGMLAGGVAHDLNNALAPVLMATEILQSDCSDPGQRRLLDAIRIGADRGAAMVKQILTFARGTEGKRGLMQVKHLLQEMVDLCRQTFPKTIEVRSEIPGNLWPLSADPTQLHQVLLNLCVNARDAMPQGGAVTLTAVNLHIEGTDAQRHSPEAKPGSFVVLGVSDNGTGMPPEVRARIFDPFYTTKDATKGTGLGLATVQNIIRNHGGFIAVTSTPGVGSEFKIYLPAQSVAALSPASPETPARPKMGQGEWILVVDDEAAIRSIAAETLQMFGYRVLTAADGAQGVALCAQHREKLRLMIVDMDMPVMNGMAAIREVRRIAPHVLTIMTSGMDPTSAEDAAAHSDTGPTAQLSKPYSADQLLRAIGHVLSPTR